LHVLKIMAEVTKPVIIVHGGAFNIPEDYVKRYRKGTKEAARIGYEVLVKGGSAVDAVESSVKALEDNSAFNAGHGSVLTESGTVEMDALIVDGRSITTGAVTCVKDISNPVSLARKVMEETSHCLLCGEGAMKFARSINFPLLSDPQELITNDSVCKSFVISKGGMPGKMIGRVGDSPIFGCGGYANREGGCSSTGHGESLLRATVCRDAIYYLEQGLSAKEAAQKSVDRVLELTEGRGGIILIDKAGNIAQAFTTSTMAWASITPNGMKSGLLQNEELTE